MRFTLSTSQTDVQHDMTSYYLYEYQIDVGLKGLHYLISKYPGGTWVMTRVWSSV